jgi:eukaryotic-like serine/threonine-protein kinase
MLDQTISHYRVIEQLGAGGMGVVYKARDTRLNRDVALKFLPENLRQDPQALERFRREALAASALNHPNICTIYDVGEHEGQPFIAMEFIEGESLRQHIHGAPLAIDQILALGLQITDALDAAHSKGIIHRDIKPGNVFVTSRGQAKILDFGLAKLLPTSILSSAHANAAAAVGPGGDSISDSLSVVGMISGTPSYMSPEQIRGDDLDARSDLFAVGLLLYEMATGRKAFDGATGGAIIEAVLSKPPIAASTLNPAVPSGLETVIAKSLQKNPELRYQRASEIHSDLEKLRIGVEVAHASGSSSFATIPAVRPAQQSESSRAHRFTLIGTIAGAALIAIVGAIWFFNSRRASALAATDTIVLADFANKTGDAVFDDTLRQGLSVQLEQSPFLSLASDSTIQQTLRLMGKPSDAKLTPEIARDLCQRTGSRAYLSGSISSLGSQYVIGVNATNCETGDILAEEQSTADSKEKVLAALGQATTKLREKLGESLKTLRALDTPIEQATTPSLEALQAYSLGRKALTSRGDNTAAIPFFERAIALDPNFAMAYASLGTSYHNLGEKNLSAENTSKAYALRTRVSEREKFYIESHYYQFVPGDLEKSRQVYDTWASTYPREQIPHNNLGVVYQALGQYEKSNAEFSEALRLAPNEGLNYANVVISDINLNRLDEALSKLDEAAKKNLDTPDLHLYRYELAFLRHDPQKMEDQAVWAAGKQTQESILLYFEANTAAYTGQLAKARQLSQQAVASAQRAGEKERAAGSEAAAAMWEALYGNSAEAKARASAALALSNGRDAEALATLALAIAGDSARAESLAADLGKRFPEDTILQFNYLPAIRAQLALNRNDAAKAIEALQQSAPYELGIAASSSFSANMYPVYIRAQAYLAAHQPQQAAAEFQKILDHPGVALNQPISALALLGQARASAEQGSSASAKSSCGAFNQLWSAADASIPIFQQSRSLCSPFQ